MTDEVLKYTGSTPLPRKMRMYGKRPCMPRLTFDLFATFEEAAAWIEKYDDAGKWPEGYDCILEDVNGQQWMYTDKWEAC